MTAYTEQYKGICGKCGEYGYGHHSRNCPQNGRNGFKFQVGNNKSGATCYYCGEKGYYMRDCKVKKKSKMIKASERSEAKEFEIFAADEEYEPMDDESIREIGF